VVKQVEGRGRTLLNWRASPDMVLNRTSDSYLESVRKTEEEKKRRKKEEEDKAEKVRQLEQVSNDDLIAMMKALVVERFDEGSSQGKIKEADPQERKDKDKEKEEKEEDRRERFRQIRREKDVGKKGLYDKYWRFEDQVTSDILEFDEAQRLKEQNYSEREIQRIRERSSGSGALNEGARWNVDETMKHPL